MRWPWQHEVRESTAGYGATLLAAQLAAAQTPSATALRTAALEFAALTYARALAASEVTGTGAGVEALTPEVLLTIGRSIVRAGESLHLIEVEGGRVVLLPVSQWDVAGGRLPTTWTYRCYVESPSGTHRVTVPAAQVLHVRWMIDPSVPHAGIGPLTGASETSRAAGGAERVAAGDMTAPFGFVTPVPPQETAETEDVQAGLVAMLNRLRGGTALIETTTGGHGNRDGAIPRTDFEPHRHGGQSHEHVIKLRIDAALDLVAATGIPRVLYGSGDGAARKESYRQWVLTHLEPIARMIAREAAMKLDSPGLTVSLVALAAFDIQIRTRALGQLIQAGVPLETAMKVALLDEMAAD